MPEKACARCYGTLKPLRGVAMIVLKERYLASAYQEGFKAKVWKCGKCGSLQWFTLPDEEEGE